MTSTRTPAQTAAVIPPEAYEAYAAFMRTGGIASFTDWFDSESGQTALTALQDQQAAAAKSERMADAKAIWRDFKNSGEVTRYSRQHAERLLAYLQTVDFAAIDASTDAADSDAS